VEQARTAQAFRAFFLVRGSRLGSGFWGSGLLRFWVRVLRRPVLDTRERFTPRARQRV